MTVFCLLGKEQPVFLVAFEFEVWTRKFEIQKSQREREGERERVDWSGKTRDANCNATMQLWHSF